MFLAVTATLDEHPAGATVQSAVRPDVEARAASNLRMLSLGMVGGAFVLPALPAVGPLCPLRRTTGVPCPLCGMTTGVTALSRGNVADAVAANPLAPVLVLIVALTWTLYAFGRDRLPLRTRTLGRGIAVALPGLWLFQLHRFDHL